VRNKKAIILITAMITWSIAMAMLKPNGYMAIASWAVFWIGVNLIVHKVKPRGVVNEQSKNSYNANGSL
jgi:hypothetical protein